MSITAEAALARLREGHGRFVAGEPVGVRAASAARRIVLARGQAPIAAVLGCADSRVPPEIVFDQGPGELFTVRVAGNVAGPTQVDSIAFAVEELGCRLVVVLGHRGCGAVRAAIASFDAAHPAGDDRPGYASIVGPIRAAIEAAITSAGSSCARAAELANVRAAMAALQESAVLARRGARIVGGCYALDSGELEWLDDADATRQEV